MVNWQDVCAKYVENGKRKKNKINKKSREKEVSDSVEKITMYLKNKNLNKGI